MKCALCLVDKETVPVKLNVATIHGPIFENYNICKECLDLAHQAYLDRDFLVIKAGTNAAPHGAHGDAHGAHH
ncbi:MAG: hypothetical protein A4E44_02210 [Methanosaeta sp. PtaB.Bin018]|jgi:hypothetical protein|nr:hypothetical protein [Methanothrix sp.]OPX73995.1 MAG: hypothetical protein A4E44_02210 [Methanosaeta sp. PtaB.Bin018]OPY45616.1 MAG: hypothetical protein A4E46_01195 [Methanosaeta sp. PtaU1.Bin016]HOV51505.1 hypothetical protein [Methanothrix sp.]